jgi:hypothetical protein
MTDNLPYFVSAEAIANSSFAAEARKMLRQLEPNGREVHERTDGAARSSVIEEEIAHSRLLATIPSSH